LGTRLPPHCVLSSQEIEANVGSKRIAWPALSGKGIECSLVICTLLLTSVSGPEPGQRGREHQPKRIERLAEMGFFLKKWRSPGCVKNEQNGSCESIGRAASEVEFPGPVPSCFFEVPLLTALCQHEESRVNPR